jgi:hypothetical protein
VAPNLSLGVIGNCAFNALVDEAGLDVWCCLPRPDGDPVFHALLGGAQRRRARGAHSTSKSRTSPARRSITSPTRRYWLPTCSTGRDTG